MSRMDEPLLEALRDELRKVAGPMPAAVHAALGSAGALGGVGALGGAVLGGGIKGYKSYRQAKEQGATTGQALGASLGGAAQGAMTGGVAGGVAGALGGGAAGYLRPELGKAMREGLDKVPGAHFGQRQIHTLTDWRPEKGIGSIGMGSVTKKPALEAAKAELASAHAGQDSRSFADKILGRSAIEGSEKRLQGAKDAYFASRRAEKMGLTSIPGYLESAVKHPLATVSAAAADQWHGMGPGMKALTVGLPAVSLAKELTNDKGEDEQGRSRGERIGRNAARVAGGFLLSPLTQTAQGVLGAGAELAGGRLGRGRVRPPPMPENNPSDLTSETGQAVAGERHITERAAGGSGTETIG